MIVAQNSTSNIQLVQQSMALHDTVTAAHLTILELHRNINGILLPLFAHDTSLHDSRSPNQSGRGQEASLYSTSVRKVKVTKCYPTKPHMERLQEYK